MSTRSERDKSKAQQDRHQMILSQLLKDEDNKYCVDCDAKGPRWASWNLGIFLCIRCAGIHRNLGVHISKVKSVNLDSWTPEQVAMVQEIGNSRARAVYEANLPGHFRRPQTDSSLEAFIRAKYEQKKYMAQGWVPPKPTVQNVMGAQEEKQLDDHCLLRPKPGQGGTPDEPKRDKKRNRPRPGSNVKLNAPATAAPSKSSPPAAQSAQAVSPTQPQAQPAPVAAKKESNIDDLLGLDSPVASATTNDLFSDFMGAPPAPAGLQPAGQSATSPSNGTPTATSEADSISGLFGNDTSTATSASEPVKNTKESILALYGSSGTGGQQQAFNMANAGGMYGAPVGQMQNGMMANGMGPNMAGMMGMPQQGQAMQQQQAQAMQQQQANMMNMQPAPAPAPASANLMVVDPLSDLRQSLAMGSVPATYQQSGQPQMAGMMGMPGSGMMGMPAQHQQQQQHQQQGMMMQQQPNMYNMNMYNMQMGQMSQQMAGLNMAAQPTMAGFNTTGAMNGWNQAPAGQTLSTNLWQ